MNKSRILSFIILIICIFSLEATSSVTVYAATNTPAAPASIKAALTSYNRITVIWSAVPQAGGYEVYQATSASGNYVLLATTTAKSYLHTNLNTGTTYYYKVRAYIVSGSRKVYGKYTVVVSTKPFLSVTTSINAKAYNYNSITVSWKGVEGASGYRVYRATSNKGKYSLIGDTDQKSYLSTDLDTGATYYYKIRAYIMVGNSRVYGKYSSVVNAKTALIKPTSLKVAASTSDSISLQWSGVEGASGYEVYMSKSSTKSFTLVSSTNEMIYVSSGLTPLTTYYYKVRAYRTIGKNNKYSSFTSVIKCKTQEVQPTSLMLSESQISLSLGQTDTLIASILPEDAATPSFTWSTSDEDVAVVDNTGIVTPISEGEAIITAITADQSMSASCTVVVNHTELKGIDVSYHQSTINWATVKKAGIQFAMLRSSYGSSSVDKCFETNYQNAKANGIPIGVYHYSYATSVTKAAAEVKFLISTLAGKQFEYPVCVDIEDAKSMGSLGKTTVAKIVLTYINALKDAGYYPMVYANLNWYTNKMDDTKLSGIDHWLAQYAKKYTYKSAVGIWQYSSSGKINGIVTKVDMDISYVDYAAKIKYLKLNGYQ